MRCLLLLVFLSLTGVSTFSQSDTMVIELGSTVRKFLISEISQITFSGISTGTGEEELAKINEILNSFTLHQNYPNPFNPLTNIAYRIPERGNVEIRIYDVQGELTKEILSKEQDAGEYTVTWDGKNKEGSVVTSGVYFYQVQFNNSLITKKMIHIK